MKKLRGRLLNFKVTDSELKRFKSIRLPHGINNDFSSVCREALELLYHLAEPSALDPRAVIVSHSRLEQAKALGAFKRLVTEDNHPYLSFDEPVLDVKGTPVDPELPEVAADLGDVGQVNGPANDTIEPVPTGKPNAKTSGKSRPARATGNTPTKANPKAAGRPASLTNPITGDPHGRGFADMTNVEIGDWAEANGHTPQWANKIIERLNREFPKRTGGVVKSAKGKPAPRPTGKPSDNGRMKKGGKTK